MALVVRTSLPAARSPRRCAPPSRASIGAAGAIPIELTQTLDEAIGQPRLRAWLLTVFAGAAMILAAIGLYGTVAFAVQQRRGELAIRLALGATGPPGARAGTARRARALAGRHGGRRAPGDSAHAAVVDAFFRGRRVRPATFASVGAALLAVSAAATYLPARSVTGSIRRVS